MTRSLGGPHSIDDTLLRAVYDDTLLRAVYEFTNHLQLTRQCAHRQVSSLYIINKPFTAYKTVCSQVQEPKARAFRSEAPSLQDVAQATESLPNPAQPVFGCTYDDYQSTVELPTTDESWPDEVSLPRSRNKRRSCAKLGTALSRRIKNYHQENLRARR